MRYRSSDNRDLSLPLKQVCGMDNVHGNDPFFSFFIYKTLRSYFARLQSI